MYFTPQIKIKNGIAEEFVQPGKIGSMGIFLRTYGINLDGTYWETYFGPEVSEKTEKTPIAIDKLPEKAREALGVDKRSLEEKFGDSVLYMS